MLKQNVNIREFPARNLHFERIYRMPGADTALRIARALNVSIEYLLAEKMEKKSSEMYSQIELARKYRELLSDMEQLQPYVHEPISAMIHRLAFAERENINT